MIDMAQTKANALPLKADNGVNVDNVSSLKWQKLVYTFALVILWTVLVSGEF